MEDFEEEPKVARARVLDGYLQNIEDCLGMGDIAKALDIIRVMRVPLRTLFTRRE